MSEEGLTDTANKLIHIGRPIEFDGHYSMCSSTI